MRYSHLFQGRSNDYAQAHEGGYHPVGEPLSHEILLKHRRGKISVGLYPIRPRDNTVKLVVLDIDVDRLGAVKRLVAEAAKHVPKDAVVVERTGGRGFHVWILFDDWFPAAKAKAFGEWLVREANPGVKVETSPKQSRIEEGGFGNLIRLPLGRHPRTGEPSEIFDADFNAIKTRSTGDGDLELSRVEPCSPDCIPQEIISDRASAQQPPLPTGRTTSRAPLPCFGKMMVGVSEGCRDKVGFALAKHLKRQGVDRTEAEARLLEWNTKNRPPLDERQVSQKIVQAYDKDYTGLDCEDPCIEQFCEPGCPILNKKVPAEVAEMFAERARGADGEERRRLAIGAIQYIAKLPHHDVMTFRDIFRENFGILKKDFEQLVREAKSDVEKREKRKRAAPPPAKGHVLRHLFEDEPHALRQSLDYHNGVVYTVVRIMDEIVAPTDGRDEEVTLKWEKNSYVVTSQREMFPLTDDELRRWGLYIEETEEVFTGSRWSKPSIRRFLEEGYEVDPAEVFKKIRNNVAHFMQFDSVQGPGFEMPPEATVDLVALLIQVSWFLPIFDAIPYVFNHGGLATGKSKLQRIQAKLSFLGRWLTAGTTTAAVKRRAHQGASLFLDNVEHIQSREFDPDQRAIILSGNTRGATVDLVEEVERKKVVRQLSVFGIRGFNNISGLDEVLASRVIRIPLVRGTDPVIMNRDPDGTPPLNPWQEVVDDLYVLAMTAMPAVKDAYDRVSKEGFEGRAWQLWRPVFAIARVIDESDPAVGLEKEMEDLATAKRYEETQAGEVEDAYWILLALVKMVILDGRTDHIPNHEVLAKAGELNPDLELGTTPADRIDLGVATRLGQTIKRLRVRKGSPKRVGGRRAWRYDPSRLKERARSYGIEIPVPPASEPSDGEPPMAEADAGLPKGASSNSNAFEESDE